MFLVFILGLAALSLAGVAGLFSIIGLAEFASGAAFEIMIFGAVLESSKLVVTGFLHYYWYELPRYLKYLGAFFVSAIMCITMIGIFGFISAAHLADKEPAKLNALKIERLNQQIATANSTISRLDGQIQTYIDDYKKYQALGAVSKGRKARKEDEERIDALRIKQDEQYARIEKLEAQKLDLNQSTSLVEAKLGPVKNLAVALRFSEDDAVNLFILMMMIPFDPLAVWLVMAMTTAITIRTKRKERVEREAQEAIERKAREEEEKANENERRRLQEEENRRKLEREAELEKERFEMELAERQRQRRLQEEEDERERKRREIEDRVQQEIEEEERRLKLERKKQEWEDERKARQRKEEQERIEQEIEDLRRLNELKEAKDRIENPIAEKFDELLEDVVTSLEDGHKEPKPLPPKEALETITLADIQDDDRSFHDIVLDKADEEQSIEEIVQEHAEDLVSPDTSDVVEQVSDLLETIEQIGTDIENIEKIEIDFDNEEGEETVAITEDDIKPVDVVVEETHEDERPVIKPMVSVSSNASISFTTRKQEIEPETLVDDEPAETINVFGSENSVGELVEQENTVLEEVFDLIEDHDDMYTGSDEITDSITDIFYRNPDVADELKIVIGDDAPFPVIRELQKVLDKVDTTEAKVAAINAATEKGWITPTTSKPVAKTPFVTGRPDDE